MLKSGVSGFNRFWGSGVQKALIRQIASENINTLIAAYPAAECACGYTHKLDTLSVLCESGALDKLDAQLSILVPKHARVMIISDNVVWEVCGKSAEQHLTAAGYRCVSHIFEARATPSVSNAEVIAQKTPEDAQILISIGGGAIADLTKFAAAKYKLPCAAVLTAPTQGGVLSPFAALINNGFAETFITPAPKILVCDLKIIKDCPRQLIASGFGEMLGTALSLFDWQVASIIKDEPYCPEIAEAAVGLVTDTRLLGAQLLKSDVSAILRLNENLLKIGLLSQLSCSSRLANSSNYQCATYLSILKDRQNTAHRLVGEHSFLYAKLLAKLYRKFFSSPETDSLPPPDNVRRLELISEIYGVNEAAAGARLSPLLSEDNYRLCCHKITEYAPDLKKQAEVIDDMLEQTTRIFYRLYPDAGFWIPKYLKTTDIQNVLLAAGDLSTKFNTLTLLKDLGYLEKYL